MTAHLPGAAAADLEAWTVHYEQRHHPPVCVRAAPQYALKQTQTDGILHTVELASSFSALQQTV